MFDAYACIRTAVLGGFRWIGESSFCETHVLLSPRLRQREIATAYPIKAHRDADDILNRLYEGPRIDLLGAPLVSSMEARGGHILFSLTNEAYEAITHRIIEESEPHGLRPLNGAHDVTEYAYMRMLTLSRATQGESCLTSPFGFGDDEAIKRALWGCFGIAERLGRGAELKPLAEYVSFMALNMFSKIETGRLVNAYNSAIQVSKCIAIALSEALQQDTIEYRRK